MASDFIHTSEVVDQVIAVLRGGDGDLHTGGLPVAWFTKGDREFLKTLEHDDWSDYPVADWMDRLPAVFVRGMGPVNDGGNLTQNQKTTERVRVVHIRKFDQSYNDAGALEKNLARARCRYAKIIGRALMHDPHKKLAVIATDSTRTEATLTCADASGAQVWNVTWDGWDLGHDGETAHSTSDVDAIRQLDARVWAIACDLGVQITTGRQ